MYKNLSPGAIGIGGSMPEMIALARETGFGGLDLDVGEAMRRAAETSWDDVRALFVGAGLRPGGFGLPVEFRRDEEAFEAGLRELPAIAEAAAKLKCFRCPTWLLPFSDALPFNENFALHARRLRACAEILKDHGCWLGLEFVGPKTMRQGHQYEFVSTLPGMIELCDAIGTGNVGLLLDCWHWYTAHGTLDQITGLRAEQVVYVHVNDAPEGIAVDEQVDNVRRLPDETGVIDTAGFLGALRRIGYDGPITPEPFSQEVNAMPAAEAARVTAQAMDRIWKLAGLP